MMQDGFLEMAQDWRRFQTEIGEYEILNYCGWAELEEQEGPVVSQSPHLYFKVAHVTI